MKNYFKKFSIMFVMTLICGCLWSSNIFAAETLKPNVTGLGPSGTWTVNDFKNVYNTSRVLTPTNAYWQQSPNSLLDGARGDYTESNCFYFYDPQYYIDVTLNQTTNIWAIGAKEYPTYFHTLVCQRWNGSSFENYDVYTPIQNGSDWRLMFSNLPAGRYKFFQKDSGSGAYTLYGEWYLETVGTTQKSISINKLTDNVQVGQTDNLTATTTPSGAEIVWTSSDTSIATVDSTGKVTGIKEGTATITAQIKGLETKATCAVTVTPKGTDPNPPVDPTNPTEPTTGDANLFIELVDGNIKSYNVSSAEITKFKQWYLDRDNTKSNKPYYEFSKGDYKDFVIHDKIDWFEVR